MDGQSCMTSLPQFKSHFMWQQDVRAIIVEAEVRCLMLSSQELTAVAAVIKDCTCVRAVIVMDRYGPCLDPASKFSAFGQH